MARAATGSGLAPTKKRNSRIAGLLQIMHRPDPTQGSREPWGRLQACQLCKIGLRLGADGVVLASSISSRVALDAAGDVIAIVSETAMAEIRPAACGSRRISTKPPKHDIFLARCPESTPSRWTTRPEWVDMTGDGWPMTGHLALRLPE